MKCLLFLAGVLFFVPASKSAIRRVGFTDVPPITGVDYTNFYAAYQAAVDGDSIYVYPGKSISQNGWPTAFGRAEIAKRLVIIGKGNWLDSSTYPKGNFGLQASLGRSYFGGYGNNAVHGIYFLAGSSGSVIMGFEGQGQYVVPNTNNITIKHNFNLIVWLGNLNISNLTVEKNYRVWFSGDDSKAFTWSNVTIRNNFIYQFTLPDHSYTGTISNNTLAFDQTGSTNGGDPAMSYFSYGCGPGCNPQYYIYLRDGTWLFQDNLMMYYTNSNAASNNNYFVITGADNATLNYNVALQSNNFTVWPGNATGNLFIPPSQVSDICEAFPLIGNSSADARYRLKPASPAKAGSSLRPLATNDAGMYGGPNPYKLSTIPSIPTIYSIGSPQGNTPTGNTIQINISTRSNN